MGAHGRKRVQGAVSSSYMPVILSLLVHAILIAVVALSFHWSSRTEQLPQVIKAVVVEDPKLAAARAQAERERQQQLRQQELAKQQELERQKAEQQRKLREQTERKAAEEKRQRELAAKRETERKQEQQQRKQREQALQDMLQREEQQREEQAKAAKAEALYAEYKALIRQKVSRNWVRPPSAGSDLQCVVKVRLVASGEVIQATVIRSSGDPVFDRSVENAVYKATPLPIPQDVTLFEFFREIEFKFRPED